MIYHYAKHYFMLLFVVHAVLVVPVVARQSEDLFDIVSVKELLKKNSTVQYQKCFDEISFEYAPFPLSINPVMHPNVGVFNETFVVTIPNGQVQYYGLVLTDNQFIEELIWKNWRDNLAHVRKFHHDQILHVPGKVAVIGQAAYHVYFHWIAEVLCRLALLELQGVEYDYLYVPQSSRFMRETLQLWGIDSKKIIASSENLCIQADQLIVPSLVSQVNFGGVIGACYIQPYLLNYVKEKLLAAALKHTSSITQSAKIFVSRKDAPQRHIINEDAVFKLFQAQGFERYELAKLSVVDQILLFYHANIVVCPQGTGLTNSIFCKEKTRIIELLQGLNDCTFWYLSQSFNLDYTPIKTTTFIQDYMLAWESNTYMPLVIINAVIDSLK